MTAKKPKIKIKTVKILYSVDSGANANQNSMKILATFYILVAYFSNHRSTFTPLKVDFSMIERKIDWAQKYFH